MTVGKTLRLRRIFTRGRALVSGSGPLSEDVLQKVRLLARTGVDAAVLTPGMLDVALEELGPMSLILRLDGGETRTQFLSVESALIMGADAVLVNFALASEAFAHVAEDARRFGLPLMVEVDCRNGFEHARLAADYGADVILARSVCAISEYRHFARATGKPCLATIEDPPEPAGLPAFVQAAIEAGVQGLVLGHESLLEPSLLTAIHALIHQGISADEALAMFRPGRTTRASRP